MTVCIVDSVQKNSQNFQSSEHPTEAHCYCDCRSEFAVAIADFYKFRLSQISSVQRSTPLLKSLQGNKNRSDLEMLILIISSGFRLNSPLPGSLWDVDWTAQQSDSSETSKDHLQRLQYVSCRASPREPSLLPDDNNKRIEVSRCILTEHSEQTQRLRLIEGLPFCINCFKFSPITCLTHLYIQQI